MRKKSIRGRHKERKKKKRILIWEQKKTKNRRNTKLDFIPCGKHYTCIYKQKDKLFAQRQEEKTQLRE